MAICCPMWVSSLWCVVINIGYKCCVDNVVSQIMQGVGVGFFSRRFSDGHLLKSSIMVMSLSYLSLVSTFQ